MTEIGSTLGRCTNTLSCNFYIGYGNSPFRRIPVLAYEMRNFLSMIPYCRIKRIIVVNCNDNMVKC